MDDQRAASRYSPLEDFDFKSHASKNGDRDPALAPFGTYPLQLDIDFLYMETHRSKTTRAEHMETFYKTFQRGK